MKVPKYKGDVARIEATLTTAFLDQEEVNYVEKEESPSEVPQCLPVEDFFGLLATRIHPRNWVATD